MTGAASVTVFGRCTVALAVLVEGRVGCRRGLAHARPVTVFVIAVTLAGLYVMPWLLPP